MQRFSKNRQAILECLRSTKIHPTAEWVYNRLKPDYPNLSLGTVYRNLCQMKKDGLILSIGVLAGEEHFDGDISFHAHVLCTRCGRIADLDIDEELRSATESAEHCTGFEIIAPQFIGYCPECSMILKNEERGIEDGFEDNV